MWFNNKIDNTLAHLASSLGKNGFSALPADPRWMEDIKFSLYYQNTTLLRQNKTASWENVIKILKLLCLKKVMNLINKHAIVSSSLFTETQNAELNKLYNLSNTIKQFH